jgi:ABC-type uncharacterized transport system YnjBCD ATPase subunit
MATGNPFVGPTPIPRGQALFGRDREVGELFHLLVGRRIVVLHSPSGAGKTSLLQAGLLPRLEQRFDVWNTIRVNQDPRDLGRATVANRYAWSAMLSLEEELPESLRTPHDRLATLDLTTYVRQRKRRAHLADRHILLVFDQFEEVLTAGARQGAAKRAFFDDLAQLLDSTRARRDVWALFVIREDYLPALSTYRERVPTRLSNTYRIDLLDVDQPGRRGVRRSVYRRGRTTAASCAWRGSFVGPGGTMSRDRAGPLIPTDRRRCHSERRPTKPADG